MRLEREPRMRFPIRIIPGILLAAVVATPLATGCRDHDHHDRDDQVQQPPPAASSPAPASDDASYRQWESETHREHRDLAQRNADEKRQYDDWRRAHDHR